MKTNILPKIFLGILLLFLAGFLLLTRKNNILLNPLSFNGFGQLLRKPTPIPTPAPVRSPTPTPTPRPLTFAEMNALYGPCAYLPTLFYHHVQSAEQAKALKQTGLTVFTPKFQEQMQYLKDRGYTVVTMQDLVNFFDGGAPLARKPILVTFDDGYGDFYTDALPILRNLGFRATVFTITGLVNNTGYLSWEQIAESAGNGILFGDHTWSHKSLPAASSDVQKNEISLADVQLSEKSLNSPKVFAYPYGGYTTFAESYLKSLGYQVAFGTVPGSTLCKKQRFNLPRIRVGNVNLSYYGF